MCSLMRMSRIRKPVNVTIDPELADWLNTWRKSQAAEVPFGRALDACIRAFREALEAQEAEGKPKD